MKMWGYLGAEQRGVAGDGEGRESGADLGGGLSAVA